MNTITPFGGAVLSWILVSVYFCVRVSVGETATYYTAKTGSDSNSCIQAQSVSMPMLTIAAGVACMTAGDTLVVNEGTYLEAINDNIPSGLNPSQPTTVRSNTGDRVTLRPTAGAGPKGFGGVVWLAKKSNIVIDGLIIDATTLPGSPIYSHTTNNVTIQNAEVKGGAGNCVTIQGKSINNIIRNNAIHDCGGDRLAHGIYIWNSGHIVERNEIYNSSGHGVHLYNARGGVSNNIVRYNYIHDNNSRGILIGSGTSNQVYGNIVGNNRTDGIVVGYHSPNNTLVYGNNIYSNGASCIVIRSGSENSMINNNVCWQNGSDSVRDQGSLSRVTGTRVTNPFSDTRAIESHHR